MHQVRAESVVLACYNALVPRLLPELPSRAEGRAGLLGEGADALHQRAAAALDVVQAAGRRQHQRTGDVPPEHQPGSGLDRRRLPGRDHARRADRRAHGAQPEQAGAAAQGAEPHRPAGTADDDVPRLRAVDPPAVRADARRHRLRSRPPTSSASPSTAGPTATPTPTTRWPIPTCRPSSGRMSSAGGASAR